VTRPYGEFTASSWQTNESYITALKTTEDEFKYDYAALSSIPLYQRGSQYLYAGGFQHLSPINDVINLAGYPHQ